MLSHLRMLLRQNQQSTNNCSKPLNLLFLSCFLILFVHSDSYTRVEQWKPHTLRLALTTCIDYAHNVWDIISLWKNLNRKTKTNCAVDNGINVDEWSFVPYSNFCTKTPSKEHSTDTNCSHGWSKKP